MTAAIVAEPDVFSGAPDQIRSALHVEDDVGAQHHYRRFYQEAGYKVVFARSYEEALRMLDKQRFDVYALDDRFPDKGDDPSADLGWYLQTEIKWCDPNAHVLFVSGNEELYRICLKVNVPFFFKPLEADRFVRHLAKLPQSRPEHAGITPQSL